MAEALGMIETRGFAAMVEAIGQTRSEIIERHGDPAASGEAAIAEFRNAVEQLQDLVLDTAKAAGASDLSSQIAFQTNRLAGAADRLERSMGGLRTLLGLLDDLDQRLRRLARLPGPTANGAEPPSAAVVSWGVAPLAERAPRPSSGAAMPSAVAAPSSTWLFTSSTSLCC